MSGKFAASEKENTLFAYMQAKPLLISLSFTLIALSLLALLICYGPLKENATDLWVPVITYAGILIAGFLSGRKVNGKGYLAGCISGALYILSSYLMAALAFGSPSMGKQFFVHLITGIILGAFGGIIGVNAK